MQELNRAKLVILKKGFHIFYIYSKCIYDAFMRKECIPKRYV